MVIVPDPTDDPVLLKRARIARAVTVGQRVGYGLFAVSAVLFFVALLVGPTTALANAVVACLVIGSLILAPAIIFGYGVKAADRADRGLDSGH